MDRMQKIHCFKNCIEGPICPFVHLSVLMCPVSGNSFSLLFLVFLYQKGGEVRSGASHLGGDSFGWMREAKEAQVLWLQGGVYKSYRVDLPVKSHLLLVCLPFLYSPK